MDNDALTYSVFYMPDGQRASAIAISTTNTSLPWDSSQVAGSSQGRIVVLAFDGVNEGRGVSAPFAVGKKGPALDILSPDPAATIPAGTEVTLLGSGFDLEDGFLPSNALSFHSDRDGDLETGDLVVATLSTGTHNLSLRGADSDGNVAETNITLTVAPAEEVPVLESLSPPNAPVGAEVTLTGPGLRSHYRGRAIRVPDGKGRPPDQHPVCGSGSRRAGAGPNLGEDWRQWLLE